MGTTSRTSRAVGTSERRPSLRLESTSDLAKFTAMAAILAMFCDAAVGHALLWENDPFWTYWATDTFLIATIFGIGTALIGVGAARGAAVAAVQAVVLTIYYWTLSPIGLPSSPEWLDLQHTWVTGIPVHFGVYYLGYLIALWIWQRRAATQRQGEVTSVRSDVGTALLVAAGVVLVSGIAQGLALDEIPGFTWFLVRVIIAFVVTLVWRAAAGRSRAASVAGAIMLAFVLLTYSHYLGPVGLPDADLRLLEPDAPPADVHWLSYVEEWLVVFPITVVVSVVAFLIASVRQTGPWTPMRLPRAQILGAAVGVIAIVGAGTVAGLEGGPDDHRAEVRSVGAPSMGPFTTPTDQLVEGDGELSLTAQDRNPRFTPLPPHDRVDLVATFTDADGSGYEVVAQKPMVSDPHGRFTTWGGVGFDKWHHGRSGIGSDSLPPVRSEVAVFALGEVSVDGEVIARGVPVHAATVANGGVNLFVGDPQASIPGIAGGSLRVVWPEREGQSPERHQRAQNALGIVVLIALIALALTALRNDDESGPAPSPSG